MKQRRYSCAATHQQGTAAGSNIGAEPIPKRVDHIEFVALFQFGQFTGTVAYNLYQKAHGTNLLVNVVYRYWPAQHHLAAPIYLNLHELSRSHWLHLAAMLQNEAEIFLSKLLAADDCKIMYLFHSMIFIYFNLRFLCCK